MLELGVLLAVLVVPVELDIDGVETRVSSELRCGESTAVSCIIVRKVRSRRTKPNHVLCVVMPRPNLFEGLALGDGTT